MKSAKELLQAVAYLDKKMREIRDSGKLLGQSASPSWRRSTLLMNCSPTRNREGFDMEEFKRRIDHMQAALDAVMPEQDKLF